MILRAAWRRVLTNGLLTLAATSGLARARDDSGVKNTQAETIPLTTPQQALDQIKLPEGFQATLFAAEPDVRQPIALATDSKGRLWVAENQTYADQSVNFDLSQHDRIVILEDTNHDGRSDRRVVFWEGAQRLTSVEVGFGGTWALCPPQLLFLPDRNGDDVIDGPPEVVLDGWDAASVRHNIANGLRWGPDGWLYGRHGILATSLVGAPGTPETQRTPINCGIWRYHPTRKTFEVVCQGTTNPWGMDWDDHGELFFINTVIGHLWHAVPGAHFRRMYGEDFNPYLYGLIEQTADHFHWDRAAEVWNLTSSKGVSPSTDQLGGGHAHAGLMFSLGDNWPESYRNSIFTINLHGLRINRDTIARQGAGYVGKHAPDFMKTTDPWFRAVELISGNDSGMYIADWTDIGECHESDGVHRSSGRIYKINYGQPPRPAIADVATLDDAALVRLQMHKNDWYVRQGRRILQERATEGRPMEQVHAALQTMFEEQKDVRKTLRALWCLYVTGGTSEEFLTRQLNHESEYVRSWAIKLLVDAGVPSGEVVRTFANRADKETSGLVLLSAASALQRLTKADRWPLAEAIAGHSEFKGDPVLPLMIWYGVEPAVPEAPAKAVDLARLSLVPLVSRNIARRLTSDLAQTPDPVNQLADLVAQTDSNDLRHALLAGMADALRGVRKARAPASWSTVRDGLSSSPDETVRRLVRELSVVFGDGRALEELFGIVRANDADLNARREAIRVLVEARAPEVVPLLNGLLPERDLAADAIRGLAAFDNPETPQTLLAQYRDFPDDAKGATIVALSARPASAKVLLDAVAKGTIDRALVPAFEVRQILGFPDPALQRLASSIWPDLKTLPAETRERIATFKSKLDPETLAKADLVNGRRLFTKSCITCHTLFGEGAKIGPDLTGSQRSNLDYLLENIVDPAATVGTDYSLSTIVLADGRILNGIVSDQSGPTLAIQTPTERLVVTRTDVEEIRKSKLSLMPDGLLNTLPEADVRDLISYLMSPRQVPLPADTTGARAQGDANEQATGAPASPGR
ncbi:MAG: PVC-type heme-binding CxxCH protein [Isosphaeraceae bacterium]